MDERPLLLEDSIGDIPQELSDTIYQFSSEVPTLEDEKGLPFILLQDGKSQAFYIECHVKADIALPIIDQNAVLDPEEQVEYRLQRDLRPTNLHFLQMVYDAENLRQFSDIIAEYDTSYNSDFPLKLLGGQHRTAAIQEALEKGVNRFHGFRIYFGLSMDQRLDIAKIANTNIAISGDLLDRMQETLRGPHLRTFSQAIGILTEGQDFADRRGSNGRITVRQARTFVVNFYEGLEDSGDIETTLFVPYLCNVGQEDSKYLSLIHSNPDLWEDERLLRTGREFSRLHEKQHRICSGDSDLNTGVFRNKAVSFSVLSSWAFVAGLLQESPERLDNMYSITDNSGRYDPLNAKAMTESKSPRDPPIYRGLGVRYGALDRARVTELLLQYSDGRARRISKRLCESAIATHDFKTAALRAERLRR